MDTFGSAVSVILIMEGGYVCDPADPGGETNFGISKRAYPDLDIKALTQDQAKDIYHRDYWGPLCCDQLPYSVALLLFDAGVNQGQKAAITLLQQAAKVPVDDKIGPHTIEAAKHPSVPQELAALRAVRYASEREFPRYGKGWMDRLFSVFHHALTDA